MIRRVHELRERWTELGADQFRIGVGVHSGQAIVGAVGSPTRLDYTAHGDIVNTASRIESANKELNTEILLSQAVFDALSPMWQQRFRQATTVHEIAVKGKQGPLVVHAIDVRAVADDSRETKKDAGKSVNRN